MGLGWTVCLFLLGWPFRLLQATLYQLLIFIKGSKKAQLSPIQEAVLLDPAVVLAARIRAGKVKSEEALKAYIDRIRQVNPVLNAVVEDRFEDALKEAREADEYVLNSGKTPEQLAQEKPFLGVPFTAKDAIAIQGLTLTAGVVARRGTKAEADCEAVSLMRGAGAIPLCVTNVPQLCTWWDASNNLYGTTVNPHDLTRTPGGSSGGEGAIISSGGSLLGLGNDIGGSIRNPCLCCGIFGHKPTAGIVSNAGQWPTSHGTGLDQFNATGSMCRYAVDLLPTLRVIAGPNASKLHLDAQVDLKSLKVYFTEDYINHPLISSVDPEMKQAVRKVVKHLSSTRGLKVQKVSIPLLNDAWTIWMTKVQTTKVPISRPNLCTKNPGEFKLSGEITKCLLGKSDHTFNFLHLEALSAMYNRPSYQETNRKNNLLADQLANVFKDLLGEDGVFIFPSGTGTAPFHSEQNLRLFNQAYLMVFNVLGFPVSQCPVGLSSEKLPLGVQVVSNLYNDRMTLAVAREIEEQFGGWKSPSRVLLH